MISIVACCPGAKVCTHVARDFRSQHSTWPLMQVLSNEAENDDVKLVWFVDDSITVGPLQDIENDRTTSIAYRLRELAKTILIVKHSSSLKKSAQKRLKNTGIKITDQGEHHLRAVIRTGSFREQFIKNKVEWMFAAIITANSNCLYRCLFNIIWLHHASGWGQLIHATHPTMVCG